MPEDALEAGACEDSAVSQMRSPVELREGQRWINVINVMVLSSAPVPAGRDQCLGTELTKGQWQQAWSEDPGGPGWL